MGTTQVCEQCEVARLPSSLVSKVSQLEVKETRAVVPSRISIGRRESGVASPSQNAFDQNGLSQDGYGPLAEDA